MSPSNRKSKLVAEDFELIWHDGDMDAFDGYD